MLNTSDEHFLYSAENKVVKQNTNVFINWLLLQVN